MLLHLSLGNIRWPAATTKLSPTRPTAITQSHAARYGILLQPLALHLEKRTKLLGRRLFLRSPIRLSQPPICLTFPPFARAVASPQLQASMKHPQPPRALSPLPPVSSILDLDSLQRRRERESFETAAAKSSAAHAVLDRHRRRS